MKERPTKPTIPLSPRQYTRREVLGRIAGVSVAAAATAVAGGILATHTPRAGGESRRIRDHRVAPVPGATELAVVRGPDAADNVRRAITALGGIERFVRPGERVVVKPNAGWNRLPEQGANASPEVVAAIVRLCVGAGASAVWVSDVSINNAERCFERSGIGPAARAAGARLVLPDGRGFRPVALDGRLLRDVEVLWPFVDADRVINVPAVKQHGLTGATMALKNWYGVLGGHRARLHQQIEQAIVDLATMLKPTRTVLDGTRGLVANGPSGGSLDDVRRADTIIAGTDEVAVDAAGAGLLGRAPADLPYLLAAEAAGLGRTDWRALKVAEVGG